MRSQRAEPLPRKVVGGLAGGVLAIIVSAAIGNIGHTYSHVDEAGQHGWYAGALAITPDVGLLIGITLLTYRRRSFWGWMIILASAAFVSWSAFSEADGHGWPGRVVALAPVLFAAIGAGLLESIRGESVESMVARAIGAQRAAEARVEGAERRANDTERTANERVERAEREANERAERAEREANERAERAIVEANERAEVAERSVAQAQANAERSANVRSITARQDDVDAADAFAAWVEREGTDDPMSNAELAELLGKSSDAARMQANRWRKSRVA